jgi:hypothetical protein
LLLLIAVLFGFDSNLWAVLVGVTCPVGFEVGVETKQNLTATYSNVSKLQRHK